MRRWLPLFVCAVALFLPGMSAAQTAPATRPAAPLPTPPPIASPTPAPGAPATASAAQGGQVLQCGQPVPPPRALPPAGSGPILYTIAPCFQRQGGASVVEPQTYLYYIQTRPSRPSAGTWISWNDETERSVLEDFKRLWATNFLDDLSIEVHDYTFTNGVIGKLVTYHMEERQRIKIVDYVGTKKLEQTKIDEKLKEDGLQVRLDAFIDPGLVRRIEGVIRGMLAEKGYLDGRVTHTLKEVPGGPKLVNLSFQISEGPQYKIRDIDFQNNKALSDSTLGRKMKTNKEQWFLSFVTGRGTYLQEKFEEDAEKVVEVYRDKGYIRARVGQPEVKTLEDSPDGKTRFVQLKVPVTEGERYRVGSFQFAGNEVVKSEGLRSLFKLKEGQYYSDKPIRKGLEKAREVYGTGGYFEFTGFPDLKPRDEPEQPEEENETPRIKSAADVAEAAEAPKGPPVVDVTMRMQEGKQYFVNRITFVGNNTTRDNVIRREVRLFENGVFNTEALKYSVKRLNQLGYFKNLEGEAIDVQKTPGVDNKVDVTLKLEEQNRNQLTFGAGVSQWDGFFGQLSFQTANFMGRGETLTLAIQAGSRARNYQVAFTEPYMFDRPITMGFDIYNREYRWINSYTQASKGGNVVFGFPIKDFTRGFVTYSLESTKVTDLGEIYSDYYANNPFLADALLIGEGGSRVTSKITPAVVHNTVDNPMFPTAGKRLSGSMDFAGLGGDVNFLKPRIEGVWYIPQNRRISIGMRAQFEYLKPYGSTAIIPIYERLVLGGEYSVRGFDLRSIGPRDPATGLVIGGNKSLLFNFEYLIAIAGPVRLVLFYDAGQVPGLKPDQPIPLQVPLLSGGDGLLQVTTTPPLVAGAYDTTIFDKFRWDGFKVSTGAEVRFFMPVLNVPFRLIFAANPWREGVLDNDYQPAKNFTFRFAVGQTF
jgi:outer membrane protein insertion porin family